jgi:hypothetical protein
LEAHSSAEALAMKVSTIRLLGMGCQYETLGDGEWCSHMAQGGSGVDVPIGDIWGGHFSEEETKKIGEYAGDIYTSAIIRVKGRRSGDLGLDWFRGSEPAYFLVTAKLGLWLT